MESEKDRTQSFVALTKGLEVGHYRIIDKIGGGGMGEVYLAEDTQLDRKVALKFLPPHLSQDEAARARFTREAKAAAKLDHPNIVQVFEVGEFQGRRFFAMAHIKGKSLRDVIKGGKLSITEAIELTRQICEGLHEAHSAGVIHRDIKPGNIIIDSKEKARLLDFGLASVAGEDKLTKTGSTLGTVGYMSPEQIEGKHVDHRSDLFSVGVILYEMLTGRRPFEGDTDAAVARSITDSTPEPVARYKSGTTGEVQRIVDKALQKDPALRYQHADGMLSDLKALETGADRVRSKRIRLWSAATALIVLACWFAVDRFILPEESKSGRWSKSIAVLVFHDFSPEQNQAFFCEGMTDAIIGRLSGINQLKVISLTSVLRYGTRDRDLKKIGRDLGVETILEGSIMRADDRVRIRAQLIDVDEDAHLWSQQYDRQVQDVFAVQDEISRTIVNVMRVELMGKETTSLAGRGTDDIEAYNLYLQARHLWRKRVGPDIEKAIEYLEQVIELDPEFVLAHAALADAWNIIPGYHYDYDWRGSVLKAKAAAQRALELDDLCVEAHAALGQAYYTDGDNARAEEQFQRAINLNPGYAWAHLWYSNLLDRMDDRNGKVRELEATLELDPLSIVALNNLAWIKEEDNEIDKAEELYRRLLELTPDNTVFRRRFAYFLFRQNRIEESLAEFKRLIEIDPEYWTSYGVYAAALDTAGRKEAAESVFTDAIAAYPGVGELYASYGDFLIEMRKDFSGALAQYRQAIEFEPERAGPYNQLAYCYLEAKITDSALWAVNKALELDPDRYEYWDSKGEICNKIGMPDSALVAYRRCLEINPNQTMSITGMLRAALLTGKWELADSLAEADANQDKPAHYRAFGRMRQALALAARGRFRESIQLFHENAKVDSIEFGDEWSLEEENARWFWYWNLLDIFKYYVRDPAAIEIGAAFRAFAVNFRSDTEARPQWVPVSDGSLAYIYARVGEFDQARMWLDTMRHDTDSSDSRDERLLHFYQGAVALEQGQYDTAIAHLKINGYTHMRGMASLGAGQVKEAVKQFEWAVNHRATNRIAGWEVVISWCYYGLGRAYEADGQIEKAIEQYEIFLDLWKDADDGLESVEDAKERLARLKETI